MMLLDLRQLKTFVVLAEELHFGRAASRLHVVQSAVSSQIQALERQVGTVLFYRKRGAVSLTKVGQIFLSEARKTLARAEHALQVARRAVLRDPNVLNFGFTPLALAMSPFSVSVRDFVATYPDVSLRMRETALNEQIRELTDGTLDVGLFFSFGLGARAGLTVRVLSTFTWTLAVHLDHPLVGSGEVTVDRLAGETLILVGEAEESDRQAALLKIYLGRDPEIVFVSTMVSTALTAASIGLGVAIIPTEMVDLKAAAVAYRPLTGIDRPLSLCLATRGETRGRSIEHFMTSMLGHMHNRTLSERSRR